MIEVLRPGLLSTIQDQGRHGFQAQGINVSGAMDRVSATFANALVGNEEHMAVLEITMLGPNLRFNSDQVIALAGADLSANVPRFKPIQIKAGEELSFSGAKLGRYAYLAIRGGFNVPNVMRSFSTNLKAGFGGFKGRALKKGDRLDVHTPNDRYSGKWTIDSSTLEIQETTTIRAIKGPEWDWPPNNTTFFQTEFELTQQSDRMGYRLQTTAPLPHQREMISTGLAFGTVQVPPDGHPIVLMADHQTTGGYPRIAQVITADLSVMAQTMPGKNICFQEVSLEEARDILHAKYAKLEIIKEALRLKWS